MTVGENNKQHAANVTLDSIGVGRAEPKTEKQKNLKSRKVQKKTVYNLLLSSRSERDHGAISRWTVEDS